MWLWIAVAIALAAALALWWLRRRYDRFQAWAIARLQDAHPDLTVESSEPAAATARLAGVPVRIDLASLFRRLRGRPDPAALDRVVDAMRAALPVPDPPPFAHVRGAILPLIKRAEFVATLRRYPPALHLVARPFAEGLAVVYAVLGFHQITYVTAGMQRAWPVGGEDLHALALANLRRRTEHLLTELGGPRRVYEHLDGFEAARVLIPDLVTPPEITDPVLAVPDEHVLIVADAREAEDLAAAAARAYAAARRPLTPAVFRVREPSLVPEVIS